MESTPVMDFYVQVAGERMFEPAKLVAKHLARAEFQIRGEQPFVDAVNKLEYLRQTIHEMIVEMMSVPVPEDRGDLPYLNLSVDAYDVEGDERQRLGVFLYRDPGDKISWWVSFWLNRRDERRTVLPCYNDAVDMVNDLVKQVTSKAMAQIDFETPAAAPSQKPQTSRARRPR